MASDSRLDLESGLYTQRMLELLFAREVMRAKRYPSPLALIYFALCLPEEYTPEIQDGARLIVSSALHTHLREVDIPGHYQGNYLVVLPETDGKGCRLAAERLIRHTRGRQVAYDNTQFTISTCAGLTSHPGGKDVSDEELLSQAASALWEAQKRGPSSIVTFEEIRGEKAG